jgi:glycosyltransferase involved in cell wall biosynthesis
VKITFSSHAFAPSVGGIETMSLLLAQEFVRRGHEVWILTQTPPGSVPDEYKFRITRTPSAREIIASLKWCDVCYHNNISLQTAWPLLLGLVQRPLVVTHATWLFPASTGKTFITRLKRFALGRTAASIAISRAMEEHIGLPSYRIGNAYDDATFFEMPDVTRDRELCFLGRLVSDKGADILLDALALLKNRNLMPSLSIIGDGEEKELLQHRAAELGLNPQVRFLGARRGLELTRLLDSHRILVAPARWAEPFGIIALEGIGCGCVVVGTEEGGLPDAIGPCGVTVPNGDADKLAEALEALLTDEHKLVQYQSRAHEHLRKQRLTVIADQYLEVFNKVLDRKHIKGLGPILRWQKKQQMRLRDVAKTAYGFVRRRGV